MNAPLFETRGLRVAAAQGGAPILTGVDLAVGPGEIHAVMGPNGSGKSTLAQTLLGSPEYRVIGGSIHLHGDDVTALGRRRPGQGRPVPGLPVPPDHPGRLGHELPAPGAQRPQGRRPLALEIRLSLMEWMERLEMDPAFAERHLNEGFSGGEKKRNEILQMALLQPDMAILDETDSGLDVDALRVVAKGVEEVRKDRPEMGVVVITHYQRLLDHLRPDAVHLLLGGRIVESGGPDLARRLEAEGYESWR